MAAPPYPGGNIPQARGTVVAVVALTRGLGGGRIVTGMEQRGAVDGPVLCYKKKDQPINDPQQLTMKDVKA